MAKLFKTIEKNSLIDGWTPQAKVIFHSGKNDDITPHFNTVNAYNALKKKKANVNIYEYVGDHYAPIFDYLVNTLKEFKKIKK